MSQDRNHHEKNADQTAEKQRRLQSEQDRQDAGNQGGGSGGSGQGAAQTGARDHPEPPMPAQHLEKPGREHEMEVRPQYQAPHYKGSGKLEGMATIVTGGDSGIGRAVAVLFAREGADVAIIYLEEDQDAQETQRCVEGEGRRCLLIRGDVKDPASCHGAVEQVVQTFGKLDVLVNNAGFQEHADSLEQITDERLDETMRTNVYGYFHMARAALPHLKQGCSIVNTGSVTGLSGKSTLLDYSASKGAIHAFTKALAGNLAEKGIRVNAIAPGPVWTPLNPADQPEEKIESFGAQTALKRPAQPEELAPAYVFLAAPSCSSYITGIVLPVTGSPG